MPVLWEIGREKKLVRKAKRAARKTRELIEDVDKIKVKIGEGIKEIDEGRIDKGVTDLLDNMDDRRVDLTLIGKNAMISAYRLVKRFKEAAELLEGTKGKDPKIDEAIKRFTVIGKSSLKGQTAKIRKDAQDYLKRERVTVGMKIREFISAERRAREIKRLESQMKADVKVGERTLKKIKGLVKKVGKEGIAKELSDMVTNFGINVRGEAKKLGIIIKDAILLIIGLRGDVNDLREKIIDLRNKGYSADKLSTYSSDLGDIENLLTKKTEYDLWEMAARVDREAA